MNAEYLLDAIGQLDDDLVQEAEQYRRPKPKTNYGQWLSWAASFAVVIMLGWWVTHPGKGGGSSADPSQTSGGGAPSGSLEINEGQNATPGSPDAAGGYEHGSVFPEMPETDFCAAIMVDGVVYWSTGTPIPIEVDEDAVRTVTSYTDTVPEADGQTNFSRDLSAQYAMTDQGLVVLVDSEWVLFDPVPPWEK